MVERFVGLDVSQRSTSVCILDGQGKRVWRGKCAADPAAIEAVIRARAGGPVRVGVETGPLTPWLAHELRGRGLEVVCLDARRARAALALRPNKTDATDAEGLAQILRLGWYRSVHVKSYAAHRLRATLGARMQLVNMVTEPSNHVRGVPKVFGLVVEGGRAAASSPTASRRWWRTARRWRRWCGPCSRPGAGCAGRLRPMTSRCAPRPRSDREYSC
jgi:transposase